MQTRSRPHGADIQVDRQQAVLLDRLRHAQGNPVSYAELRDAGIEFPASVVSELELAGIGLERSYNGRDNEARVVGVRLARPYPAESPVITAGVATADGQSRPDSVHVYRTSSLRLIMELFIALGWWLAQAALKLFRGGRDVLRAIAGKVQRRSDSASRQSASGAGQAAARLRTPAPVAGAVALVLAVAALAAGLTAGLPGGASRPRARLSANAASRHPTRSAKLPLTNVSAGFSGVAAHIRPQPAPASQPATGSSGQALSSQAPPAPPPPHVNARAAGRATPRPHPLPRPATKHTSSPPQRPRGHPPHSSGPPRHRPRPSGGAAPHRRAGQQL